MLRIAQKKVEEASVATNHPPVEAGSAISVYLRPRAKTADEYRRHRTSKWWSPESVIGSRRINCLEKIAEKQYKYPLFFIFHLIN